PSRRVIRSFKCPCMTVSRTRIRHWIYRAHRPDEGPASPSSRYVRFTPQSGHQLGIAFILPSSIVGTRGSRQAGTLDASEEHLRVDVLPESQATNQRAAGSFG